MDLVSLVSNTDQRLDHNVLRNQLSQYEDNGLWDSKIYQYSFKEELGNGLCCDALLTDG
jgi:hypothetical protein